MIAGEGVWLLQERGFISILGAGEPRKGITPYLCRAEAEISGVFSASVEPADQRSVTEQVSAAS